MRRQRLLSKLLVVRLRSRVVRHCIGGRYTFSPRFLALCVSQRHDWGAVAPRIYRSLRSIENGRVRESVGARCAE